MSTQYAIIDRKRQVDIQSSDRCKVNYEHQTHRPLPNHYTICCHPLEILAADWKKIGSGMYGCIWACSYINRKHRYEVAVKVEGISHQNKNTDKCNVISSDDIFPIIRESTLREIAITRRLPSTHPNLVIPHLVIYSMRNIPYLLMPLAQTNLTKLISQHSIDNNTKCMTPLSIEAIAHCIHNICSGLHYLHINGICHNDIHTDNVLVFCNSNGCFDPENPNIRYALSDFGISTTDTMSRLVKPPFVYRATMASPELIASKLDIYYTGRQVNLAAIDVWAVGTIGLRFLLNDMLPWENAACKYSRATICGNSQTDIESSRIELLVAMCDFFDQLSTFKFNVFVKNGQNIWAIDKKVVSDVISITQRKRSTICQVDPIDVICRRRRDKSTIDNTCQRFWKEVINKMLDFDAGVRFKAYDVCNAIVQNEFYDIKPRYVNDVTSTDVIYTHMETEILPNLESHRPFVAMFNTNCANMTNVKIIDKLIYIMLGYFFSSWTFDPETVLPIYCVEVLRSAELFCLYAYASFNKYSNLTHINNCRCCIIHQVLRLASIMCIVTKVQMHTGYDTERAARMAVYTYKRFMQLNVIPITTVCSIYTCTEKEHIASQFYLNAIPLEIKQIVTDLDGDVDLSYPSDRAISLLLTATNMRSTYIDKMLYVREVGTTLQTTTAYITTVLAMSLMISMAPTFLTSVNTRNSVVEFCFRMSTFDYIQCVLNNNKTMNADPYLTNSLTIDMANIVRDNLLSIARECSQLYVNDVPTHHKNIITIACNSIGIFT